MDLSFRNIARHLWEQLTTSSRFFKTQMKLVQKDLPSEGNLTSTMKAIIGIIDSPTLHLNELVAKVFEVTGVVTSVPTVCKLLARYGYTRKKMKLIALQRIGVPLWLKCANTPGTCSSGWMKLDQMPGTCLCGTVMP